MLFTLNFIASHEVTLEVIEPDPASQPFPCPNQTVIYECTVDGYLALSWILPTSDMSLVFSAVDDVGTNRTTLNGQFNATLNNNKGIPGSSPVVNLMTSALLINPPLNEFNGLAVTCVGAATGGGVNRMAMTNVTLSGE